MELTDEQIQEITDVLQGLTDGGFWNARKEKWPGNDNLQYWVESHEDGLACAIEYHDANFIANAPSWIRQLLADRQAWKEEAAENEKALLETLDRIHDMESEMNEIQGQLNKAVEVLEKTLEYTSEWKTKTRINNFLASLSQEKHTRKQPQEHPLDLLYTTKGLNGYQFEDWMKERTTEELESLSGISFSLQRAITNEKESREVNHETGWAIGKSHEKA